MVTTYPPPTPSIDQVETSRLPYGRLDMQQTQVMGLPAFSGRATSSSIPPSPTPTHTTSARVRAVQAGKESWIMSPWFVKDAQQYPVREVVLAALEHCCKLHKGEVARCVYLPFAFREGTILFLFHQVEVRVRTNVQLPRDVILCAR